MSGFTWAKMENQVTNILPAVVVRVWMWYQSSICWIWSWLRSYVQPLWLKDATFWFWDISHICFAARQLIKQSKHQTIWNNNWLAARAATACSIGIRCIACDRAASKDEQRGWRESGESRVHIWYCLNFIYFMRWCVCFFSTSLVQLKFT